MRWAANRNCHTLTLLQKTPRQRPKCFLPAHPIVSNGIEKGSDLGILLCSQGDQHDANSKDKTKDPFKRSVPTTHIHTNTHTTHTHI